MNWKKVETNGVSFRRAIAVCSAAGAIEVDGVPRMADMLEASRQRERYGR